MRTTVVIDQELLDRLVEVGHFRTRKEAICTAVAEFVRRKEREALLEMAGQIEFLPDHLHTLHSLEDDE